MSKIQWTDVTDNPLRVKGGGHWCQKISAGCQNCYAEKINLNRYFKGNLKPYSGKPPEIELDEKLIKSWARQRKPKRHFVCSMTDLFGEWVPLPFQIKTLEAMWNARSSGQVFQVLTKRPTIAKGAIESFMNDWDLPYVPDNIWLGVSIESQAWLSRSKELAKIPCNRFWSCEPLLENLGQIGDRLTEDEIRWVIVGGESGKSRIQTRPFHIEWGLSIIEQCKNNKIPVFMKQLGSQVWKSTDIYPPFEKLFLTDSKGGDWSEWSEDLQIREFPEGMQQQ